MKVKMAQVETSLSGPGNSQYTVGVRLVIAAKPASFVNEFDKFSDFGVIYAGILRIGDQQCG